MMRFFHDSLVRRLRRRNVQRVCNKGGSGTWIPKIGLDGVWLAAEKKKLSLGYF